MAVSDKTDVLITSYTRRPFPALQDSVKEYLQYELERIESTLNSLETAAIQVTDTAPSKPIKGMVRYNQAPWYPLGGTTVALVVYNGTAWVAV